MHTLLLCEQERWALPQHCISQITELQDWSAEDPPRPLSSWGLPFVENDPRDRVLYLTTKARHLAVRVHGGLAPLQVEDDCIFTLPVRFFPQGPASALIRLETGGSALLLDPQRLLLEPRG